MSSSRQNRKKNIRKVKTPMIRNIKINMKMNM